MGEFKKLSKDDVDRFTGGGVLRAIPAVKLFDMLRGRSGYVSCPHCRERIHPDATACPHCQRDIVTEGH